MNTYVCFLRGINVSGKNIIRMKEFRELLEKEGFANVNTYIQSGNIILSSELTKKQVEENIKHIIEKAYGYIVPVQVYKRENIKDIIANNPFIKNEVFDAKSIYFVMCNKPLSDELIKVILENKHATPKHIKWYKNTIYLYTDKGYSNNKIDNNLIEKKLNVEATARNLRTMLKMAEI